MVMGWAIIGNPSIGLPGAGVGLLANSVHRFDFSGKLHAEQQRRYGVVLVLLLRKIGGFQDIQ